MLLSPLALALSTALVLEGSVSKTIDRLLETLRWELLKDADVRYVLAHALLRLSRLPISDVRVEAAAFVQRDFDVTGPYRESLDAYYGADVVLVNFLDRRAALTAVNAWCCRATAKVSPGTVVVARCRYGLSYFYAFIGEIKSRTQAGFKPT